MHFLLHNSGPAGEVFVTRTLIRALFDQIKGLKLTLECREENKTLLDDLGLEIRGTKEVNYTGLLPVASTGLLQFVNISFATYPDLFKLHGYTYENLVATWNRQVEALELPKKYLLQDSLYTPMTSLYGQLPDLPDVPERAVLIEAPRLKEAGNAWLRELARQLPNWLFYVLGDAGIDAENIFYLANEEPRELVAFSERCVGFITYAGDLSLLLQTELNRTKPHVMIRDEFQPQFWNHRGERVIEVSNFQEARKAFRKAATGETEPETQDSSRNSASAVLRAIRLNSPPKVKGLFLNQSRAQCSIYESGVMMYEALKYSGLYSLEYLEITPENCNDIPAVDFYIMNYHHATLSWVHTPSLRSLPGKVITFVLEMLPGNPYVYCSRDDFDAFCVLDPTMNIQDPKVYAFPRPLELPHYIEPYRERTVPTIGTFGFATRGKGFELVVDAVNREFDEAVVRINMPSTEFADSDTFTMYRRSYADYLKELCTKVAKPGIRVEVSNDFMSKEQLLNWCSQNTLNCFLYSRNQPGLSATTDQAISSGRPLAVSTNETFRHLHQYLLPYPLRSLRESIAVSQSAIKKMQEDWTPRNFARRFEGVLADLGVLPLEAAEVFDAKPVFPDKQRLLFTLVEEKTSGIHHAGRVLIEALKRVPRYQVEVVVPRDMDELEAAVQQVRPQYLIVNYDLASMSWLTRKGIENLEVPTLGIIYDSAGLGMLPTPFDYALLREPSATVEKEKVSKLGPVIPLHVNFQPTPEELTIAGYAFRAKNSGFEQLVEQVQAEFDEARLLLYLPIDPQDDQSRLEALQLAAACQARLKKPGIALQMVPNVFSHEEMLHFLSLPSLHVFCGTDEGSGSLSLLEYALATQRPIAISESPAYVELAKRAPQIVLGKATLRQVLENNIAPLVPLYHDFSEVSFLLQFEALLRKMSPKPSLETFEEEVVTLALNTAKQEREFNRVISTADERTYANAIRELYELAAKVSDESRPEALIQQGFVFDTVKQFALVKENPRILSVENASDPTVLAVRNLGYDVEEIDSKKNYSLAEFFNLPTTVHGAYDIVFAVSALGEAENEEEFLSQISNLLKPGGVAIMTCRYSEETSRGSQSQVLKRKAQDPKVRVYSQTDMRLRILPVIQSCRPVDAPRWERSGGEGRAFATLVVTKDQWA